MRSIYIPWGFKIIWKHFLNSWILPKALPLSSKLLSWKNRTLMFSHISYRFQLHKRISGSWIPRIRSFVCNANGMSLLPGKVLFRKLLDHRHLLLKRKLDFLFVVRIQNVLALFWNLLRWRLLLRRWLLILLLLLWFILLRRLTLNRREGIRLDLFLGWLNLLPCVLGSLVFSESSLSHGGCWVDASFLPRVKGKQRVVLQH